MHLTGGRGSFVALGIVVQSLENVTSEEEIGPHSEAAAVDKVAFKALQAQYRELCQSVARVLHRVGRCVLLCPWPVPGLSGPNPGLCGVVNRAHTEGAVVGPPRKFYARSLTPIVGRISLVLVV